MFTMDLSCIYEIKLHAILLLILKTNWARYNVATFIFSATFDMRQYKILCFSNLQFTLLLKRQGPMVV